MTPIRIDNLFFAISKCELGTPVVCSPNSCLQVYYVRLRVNFLKKESNMFSLFQTFKQSFVCSLHAEGRDTWCDKSLWHAAVTGCCNKSPCVTCENHCRCDKILSLRSVAQIQTGLNLSNISQQQNSASNLVAAAVQTRRFVAFVCLGLKCSNCTKMCSNPHLT